MKTRRMSTHNQRSERTPAAHGFFADYRPSYNATAADAWKRGTALFTKHLKA